MVYDFRPGHIYLTALVAVEKMANVMADSATAAAAAKALALGKTKLMQPTSSGGPLWDGEKRFWHCHSDTATQIFTDTLYGQMLAHHHLQNYTLPLEMLEAHLEYEWSKNQDEFGMRVLNDPVQEDSIWMNGPPTIAYIQLQMAKKSFDDAIEPFYRMSENFRTRLRDQWNLRALTPVGDFHPARVFMQESNCVPVWIDRFCFPRMDSLRIASV